MTCHSIQMHTHTHTTNAIKRRGARVKVPFSFFHFIHFQLSIRRAFLFALLVRSLCYIFFVLIFWHFNCQMKQNENIHSLLWAIWGYGCAAVSCALCVWPQNTIAFYLQHDADTLAYAPLSRIAENEKWPKLIWRHITLPHSALTLTPTHTHHFWKSKMVCASKKCIRQFLQFERERWLSLIARR